MNALNGVAIAKLKLPSYGYVLQCRVERMTVAEGSGIGVPNPKA